MTSPDELTPITGEPPAESTPAPVAETTDVVQNPAGWSLVRHGTWEVSIGPDGMIMLPRLLAPEEVPDFISAVSRAAEIANENRAINQAAAAEAAANQPAVPESTLIIQESGSDPIPGAVAIRPASGLASPSSSVTPLDLNDPTSTDKEPTLVRPPAST